MNRLHTAVIAATLLVTATPALADVMVKEGRPADAPRREVRFADLNLDSEEGMKRLNTRISVAVRIVCGNADLRMLNQFVAVRECRRESLQRAFADRDAMIAARLAARGDPGKLAALDMSIAVGMPGAD